MKSQKKNDGFGDLSPEAREIAIGIYGRTLKANMDFGRKWLQGLCDSTDVRNYNQPRVTSVSIRVPPYDR